MWVDDVEQSSARITASYEDAMSGQPIQYSIRVLLDATHLMRRYMRTCKEGHPLYGEGVVPCNVVMWMTVACCVYCIKGTLQSGF